MIELTVWEGIIVAGVFLAIMTGIFYLCHYWGKKSYEKYRKKWENKDL